MEGETDGDYAAASGSEGAPEPRQRPTPRPCSCSTCQGCVRSAKVLASVLQDGTTLFHLNLSYNDIRPGECAILAEALCNNHTLFGLHMVGNGASVDPLGFIIPFAPGTATEREERQAKTNLYIENIPAHLRLDTGANSWTQPDAGAAAVPGAPPAGAPLISPLARPSSETYTAEGLQLEKDWAELRSQVQHPWEFGHGSGCEVVARDVDICWICENWIEQRVSYIPGWSGNETSADEVKSVVAYLSIDDFAYPLRLSRTEEPFLHRLLQREREDRWASLPRQGRDAKWKTEPCLTKSGRLVRWTAWRMLPPSKTPIQLIFQVKGSSLLRTTCQPTSWRRLQSLQSCVLPQRRTSCRQASWGKTGLNMVRPPSSSWRTQAAAAS